MAITAKYNWCGETRTVQLTPHNYGHRFEYAGVTYQIERDAHRNRKWNVYRVTWNSDSTRRINTLVIELAASRKQAIADALFQAITEDIGADTEAPPAQASEILPSPQDVSDRTITRQAEHPGYDSHDDDFHLLVDSQIIGGTYHCPVSDSGKIIEAGKQYVSYGPAGYSFGHPTREDAERVQLQAHGLTDCTVVTEPGPPPPPEPAPLLVTWEQALAEAKEKGVGRCSEHAAMAAFCDSSITYVVGAVSGQLIWEGAMRKGMTFLELGRLAGRDPIACSELMWV